MVITSGVCPVSQRLLPDRREFYGEDPLFERLSSLSSRRHLPRVLKCIYRFRAQTAAIAHQISCDCRDVSMIALGAVKCADVEAGWNSRSTRPTHPCIALWAMLAGDERVTGRGMTFRHQPSNVWASDQPLFLKSVRSDAVACRSGIRFGGLGRDLAKRRTSRRFSTRSTIL